jgi:hypothetical protein
MIDEDEVPKAARRDGELLVYDFFKYLTSLVLLILGGMLIVMKDFDPVDVKPQGVIVAIIVISSAGVLAFSGAAEIVRARSTDTPPKPSLKFLRAAAPAMLALGLGLFLSMFIDSLVK